jgi:hypothetical protein
MSDSRPNDISPARRNDDPRARLRKWRPCLLAVRFWGPLLASIACLFFFLGQFAGGGSKG